MRNIKLQKTLEKYLPFGIIKGGEFLFAPDIAIPFINDLTKHGIRITGCDLWRFLGPEKNPDDIVALLGDGILINSPDAHTVEQNAEILKDYLQNRLPDDAQLISLLFTDAETYDFYRGQRKNK